MNICKEAEKFLGSISDDDAEKILEEIGESLWSKEDFGSVSLVDVENINISNIKGTGSFIYNDEEYLFTARCGDWNGLEIVAFEGSVEPYLQEVEENSGMMIIPYIDDDLSTLHRWNRDMKDTAIENILTEICRRKYTNDNFQHLLNLLDKMGYYIGSRKEAAKVEETLKKKMAINLLKNA